MKTTNTIIGAVIGDVIGSVFEWNIIKTINSICSIPGAHSPMTQCSQSL